MATTMNEQIWIQRHSWSSLWQHLEFACKSQILAYFLSAWATPLYLSCTTSDSGDIWWHAPPFMHIAYPFSCCDFLNLNIFFCTEEQSILRVSPHILTWYRPDMTALPPQWELASCCSFCRGQQKGKASLRVWEVSYWSEPTMSPVKITWNSISGRTCKKLAEILSWARFGMNGGDENSPANILIQLLFQKARYWNQQLACQLDLKERW